MAYLAEEEFYVAQQWGYWLLDELKDDPVMQNHIREFSKDIEGTHNELPSDYFEMIEMLMHYMKNRTRERFIDLAAEGINRALFTIAPKMRAYWVGWNWNLSMPVRPLALSTFLRSTFLGSMDIPSSKT